MAIYKQRYLAGEIEFEEIDEYTYFVWVYGEHNKFQFMRAIKSIHLKITK